MQSTRFRLLSAAVTIILLLGLAIVVVWVLQQNRVITEPDATTSDSIAGLTVEQPRRQAQLANTASGTAAPSSSNADPSPDTDSIATASRSLSPAQTQTSLSATRAVDTADTAILRPTATPTPITAMQTPIVFADPPQPGWSIYSNGNQIYDLTVLDTTMWTATGGGVVVWNRSTSAVTKFTTLDGLIANRTTTVVNCPLPDFGLIFGTAHGLQIYDTRRGTWSLRNSRNSGMHGDEIATLDCRADDGLLVIGYRQSGLDVYNAEVGEWRHINRSSGLQSDTVEAVAVVGDLDALWVSSGSGLSVLTADGARFYDSTNSPLETNRINVMVGDDSETIWLGAREKVYAIRGEEWTIYSPAYLLASRFPAGEITALQFDSSGALWIGSEQGEICQFDPAAVHCNRFFTPQELEISTAITALAVDQLDRLYVATAGDGLRLYDGLRWRSFILPHNLFGNRPVAMTQDEAGYLWVVTDAGLEQLNPALLDPTLFDPLLDTTEEARVQLFTPGNSSYPVTSIQALASDPTGGLWAAGTGAGYFDGMTWRRFTVTDGLVDRRVQTVAIDGDRRVWLGTQAGLSIWNGNSFFNLTTGDGLPDNTITALLRDGDTIWIGTNAGLLRFAENRLQIYDSTNSGLRNDRIQALTKAQDGALLIGTANGLARLVDTTVTTVPELAAESITALAAMPDGVIWLGTVENGLVYFDGVRWLAPPDAIRPPAPTVTLLFVDQQDTLWVGGDGGLLRYVP